MTKTKYYDLQMDDPQDDYDVDVVNANLKKIDEQMKTRENATDALQEPEFTVAAKRENIASKEKMPKILGKIAKFFADLKAVAFTGNYNDLSDKPTSLLANGGNSDTVNSHTVESNVPKNAKFTDTTYSNFVKSGTGAKAGLVPAPSTTAGTTKYLREDGAWKNPPDTKTSIVNNNTTTEPGSALDARQANPNIEGTMAASIAQINSNLKIEGNPNCVLTNGTGELLNYKYGNIGMISIEVNLTKIEHGLIVGTGIHAPVRSIYLSLTAIDGTSVPMILNSLGELSVYYPYENHTSVARIDGCFSYICA